MTREEYTKYRLALLNHSWNPFGKLDKFTQGLLRSAPTDQIQILTAEGDDWYDKDSDAFYDGWIYRINPTWAGPTEPAKPTYVDVKPHVDRDGDLMVTVPRPGRGARFLHRMGLGEGCVGFVYGGTCSSYLRSTPIFDSVSVSDNVSIVGFKLMTPDFVRFQV